MSITINYEKRKNQELFKSLEKYDFTKTHNYVPIYTKFFSLNETNYNSINLNNKWYISNVSDNTDKNIYKCNLKNVDTERTKSKLIFFKQAPLLEAFKYMTGKYNINDNTLLALPELNSTLEQCNIKLLEKNNCAYVDGFFTYILNQLLHEKKFVHGLEYYGSFLSVKKNFVINVYDDLECLNKSDFFKKNTNILFKVDEHDYMFEDDDDENSKYKSANKKLSPIKILHDNLCGEEDLFDKTIIDETMFDDIFENTESCDEPHMVDLVDIMKYPELLQTLENEEKNTSLVSTSTYSSRTSHTGEDDNTSQWTDEDSSKTHSEDCSSDSLGDDEECVNATFPEFPVQIICMEKCENTLDDLILKNNLTAPEWFSCLMQVIMMLITYQELFSFTHNDLHTNNVMYVNTDKKHLYYCYKKKYYKVPTFGRIFKIIDFGRGIYKCNGQFFCSDSFQMGNDAATQYNIEPYFNEKKPRLEPNYSFDLCRLACSIFDYVVDDMDSIRDLNKCSPITKLIVEWCLDDKGMNVLYKTNGEDRYPDFKLYKMIARCVHNHTPQQQLKRKEFSSFAINKNKIDEADAIINIDDLIEELKIE